MSTSQKRYYDKNKGKVLLRAKQWTKDNPEYRIKYKETHKDKIKFIGKKHHLKRHYGMTVETYQALFDTQNGVCAICNQSQQRDLEVDHNHATGKVRALLCRNCNIAIGCAKESPWILNQMIEYLKKYVQIR